jgi:mannosylglycoprotein endo-beta-mannosidase
MIVTSRRLFLMQSAATLATLAGCKDDKPVSKSEQTFVKPAEPVVPAVPSSPPPLTVPPIVENKLKTLSGLREITDNWLLQPTSVVPLKIGQPPHDPKRNIHASMDRAIVPGTVLTSFINNGYYKEPFFGTILTKEIPDTLWQTNYKYLTDLDISPRKTGQRVWLRFDGINYIANVWFNDAHVGTIEGAFRHAYFDVTEHLKKSGVNRLTVYVAPPENAEGPLLPNYANGLTRGERNGGPTGKLLNDGPTFVCSSGWDWLPTIPDRETGIWRPVSLFTTGPVRVEEGLRIRALLSKDLSEVDLRLEVSLLNSSSVEHNGKITGEIGTILFSHDVSLKAGERKVVSLSSAEIPDLRILKPKLWWPNGYGDPYLYNLKLGFTINGVISDEVSQKFGVRRLEYSRTLDKKLELAITVNNLPIFIKGGNWGLDEALKRIPRQLIFDKVRLHRDANLNLIRNWVGQSTGEDFYAACDEYGILVWNDFFYSAEGGKPQNHSRYLANVEDVILHYRNHPSILLWCGANEGKPPQPIVDGTIKLIAKLDPDRLHLTYSGGAVGAEPGGFSSGGPYHWVTPLESFNNAASRDDVAFRNEAGSHSIPTLEFVQSMLPESSWECPDDFWADRDFNGNGGNGGGKGFISMLTKRYGAIFNLADFVRKSQLANYEGIKALYESYISAMLRPATSVPKSTTGMMMWMSNPAQPSFVWQMYSYDHEQHSSFFAVKRACEPVQVILNAKTLDLTVANHTATGFNGNVEIRIFNLGGDEVLKTAETFSGVAASSHKVIGNIKTKLASGKSDISFVALRLSDASTKLLCENFYWIRKDGKDGEAANPGNYTLLDTMKAAALSVSATIAEHSDKATKIKVRVENSAAAIALMVHLQLHDTKTGKRVLPAFFSDNYLNIVPGGTKDIIIEVPHIAGKQPANLGIRIDGWKLDRQNTKLDNSGKVPVSFNENAMAVEQAARTFAVC